MPLILFEIGFLERLSHSPLWGRVYSIFIRLIKFFSLINGRMCSQRNCPVCSLKPIICLSSGRLLASNRLLGIAVYIIVWTATWQRGTRKICFVGSLPRQRTDSADQSCRENRRINLPALSINCSGTVKECRSWKGGSSRNGWLQLHFARWVDI